MALNKSHDRTDPTSRGSKEPLTQNHVNSAESSSDIDDSDYDMASALESEEESSESESDTKIVTTEIENSNSRIKHKPKSIIQIHECETITSAKAMPAKTADVPTREVKYGCDSETATQDDLLSDPPQKRLSSSPSHRGRSNVSKSPSKRVFRKI